MLPSQLPRTTRVAAFRSGPRRGIKIPRGVIVVALAGVAAGCAWWLWPSGDASSEGDAFSTSAPVSFDLGEPPSKRAQQAVLDLPQRAQPAETVAARPEAAMGGSTLASPRSESANFGGAPNMPPPASPAPPPVELRQSLRNPISTTAATTAPGNSGGGTDTQVGRPSSQPTSAPAAETATPSSLSSAHDPAVARLLIQAEGSLAANKPVDARNALNRALHASSATESDRQMLRGKLADLNQKLVFSAIVTPGDAMAETYVVQSGDSLAKIVGMHDLEVDWRLVQRVNGMSDPRKLRVGQKLKLIKGPFHAVVTKREYRMDLYSEGRDSDGNRLYIRSFAVGLGENDSTPVGRFAVKSGSRLIDPHWVNPRTGERFANSDPLNPIGERWIGIEGADAASAKLTGYGIHGTIDPSSIGRDASMGCVRMNADDVALVYELLAERVSQVEIR